MCRKVLRLFMLAQAALLAQAAVFSATPYHKDNVYFPLNYKYGESRKVSTDLAMPWTNETIEVCFDQGSEAFWVFGPETNYLWGSRFPPGPCSIPAGHPYYDYANAPGHPTPDPMDGYLSISYGGGARMIVGNTSVTGPMEFSSAKVHEATVPDVTVAIASDLFRQIPTAGDCAPSEMEEVGYIDRGILGTSKYIRSPEYNSTDPHVRQDLLERGVIANKVQSMWFDRAPKGVKDTFTGGAIFGGVDTSKFTGSLVKVPSLRSEESDVGYYIPPPRLAVSGKNLNQTGFKLQTCHLDSGTINDALPITSFGEKTFLAAAGLVKSTRGNIAWKGSCDSVPKNRTIDLTFDGVNHSQSVTVKVPLRNYVRQDTGEDKDVHGNVLCRLNLSNSDDYGRCVFGAPFTTAAFFAADDEKDEIALAQGGVSVPGNGPDYSRIVDFIP